MANSIISTFMEAYTVECIRHAELLPAFGGKYVCRVNRSYLI